VSQREDEDELTRDILQLASKYGRYGYRRVTALLRDLGWEVGTCARRSKNRPRGAAPAA